MTTKSTNLSNSSVVAGTKIDLSKISFGKITQNPNGSKSVRVSYEGGPLTIQTPMLNIPWGVNPPYSEKDKKNGKEADDEPQRDSDGKSKNSKMSKWSLQMSFKGADASDKESKNVKKFLETMKSIDQLFLETLVKNRQEWFDDNKKMSNETAEAIYDRLFRRSVKERFNKTTKEAYPPCIEPKVNCLDGTFQCHVSKISGEEYDEPIDKLSLRGSSGVGIIRLTNFYIQQTSCGPTWTLMRLRADAGKSNTDFGFIDDDEEDDSSTSANVTKTPAKSVAIDTSDDEDDDTDKDKTPQGDAEDDDEDQEPEPEPEPVKVVKTTKGKGPAKK
jgi:hypothetical protein